MSVKKELIEERNRRIVERWNEGANGPEIAEEFGMSDGRVSTIISEARKKDPSVRSGQVDNHQRDLVILERWNQGAAGKEIAEELGMNRAAVSHVVCRARKKDPSVRSVQDDNHQRNLVILERFNQGAAAKEIAEEFGMSKDGIYKIIAKARKEDPTIEQRRSNVAAVAQHFQNGRSVFWVAQRMDMDVHEVVDVLREQLSEDELVNKKRFGMFEPEVDYSSPLDTDPPCPHCQESGKRLLWADSYRVERERRNGYEKYNAHQ